MSVLIKRKKDGVDEFESFEISKTDSLETIKMRYYKENLFFLL